MGIARDGLRGEEIAARVHVSRFHFDRIVAAALDETPGAFRRRLLLERAAYSLAGGAGVGETALEGRPMPERREGSPECLRKRLGEAGTAFVEIVRDARARGTWDTAFVDATCRPPESFTYGGMAAHVLTWSAYRRNVVLEALQREGVDVAHSDPLGWERAERT